MGRFRKWWRRKVRPWFQQRRGDRQMGQIRGTWPPGDPITLYVHPNLPLGTRAALDEAMNWWNTRLGREVFYVKMPGAEILRRHNVYDITGVRSVMVVDAPPLRPGRGSAEMHTNRDGELLGGEVRVRSSGKREQLCRTMTHELGHVLGLGHITKGPGPQTDPHEDNFGVERSWQGGDPKYLMTSGGHGYALLPDELEWLAKQWPKTDW